MGGVAFCLVCAVIEHIGSLGEANRIALQHEASEYHTAEKGKPYSANRPNPLIRTASADTLTSIMFRFPYLIEGTLTRGETIVG